MDCVANWLLCASWACVWYAHAVGSVLCGGANCRYLFPQQHCVKIERNMKAGETRWVKAAETFSSQEQAAAFAQSVG